MKTTAHTVFMLGIGGVGMSALARHYLDSGCTVGGYDRQPNDFTEVLESLGARLLFDDRVDSLDALFANPEACLVVYTPAVPRDTALFQWFVERGHRMLKRSEALAEIVADYDVLAVAGTHGKTTTSSLLAHVLTQAGADPTVFLGGWSLDLKGNYRKGQSQWCVVEADEFDRSFLRLHPRHAVVTSMEPDHLDIYGDAAQFEAGFKAFADQVQGFLYAKAGLPLKGQTYGLGVEADYRADYSVEQGGYRFSLAGPDLAFETRIVYPGVHNLENAVAASVLAHSAGLSAAQISAGLSSFRGVRRRFEYALRRPDRVLIDDYAHHPGELKVLIDSVRELHPDQPLWLVFQPHLYTRTRDFAEGFREQLARADVLLLLPIYPARERPIPGVDSALLLDPSRKGHQFLASPEQAVAQIEQAQPGLVVVAGAGSIDRWVEPIQKVLQ